MVFEKLRTIVITAIPKPRSRKIAETTATSRKRALRTRCLSPQKMHWLRASQARASPAVLRFEDPQETALLLADAPRTRATAGAERNDARSGSSLAKEFAILRMQASARPPLASAGLSSFVCR